MTNALEREDQDVERLARLSFRLQGLAVVFLIVGAIAALALPDDLIWVSALLNLISTAVILGSLSKIADADA